MNVTDYFDATWSPEFTCWDLIRRIFDKEHGVSLPPYHITVSGAFHLQTAAKVVDAALAPPSPWEPLPIRSVGPGDIVVFGGARLRHHVGYCVSRDQLILHLPENASARAEPLSRLVKSYKSSSAYRHATLRHCH